MSKDLTFASLELIPNDADVLIRFVGELNENLKIVEKLLRLKYFKMVIKLVFQERKKILKKHQMQLKIYMYQHQMEVSFPRSKYRW